MYQIPDFDGPFKEELVSFINFKRSLGYDYGETMIYRLSEMNRFLIEWGIKDIRIPKAAFLSYIQLKDKESTSTQEKRYTAMHGFAKFLISRKYADVYDAENTVLQRKSFTPYIYTEDEIARIFRCADRYQPEYKPCIYDNSRMMPILLRLLYSTGMRISEVLSIRLGNIDVEKGLISVLDGKNHVGRNIVVSASMRCVLENYIRTRTSCGADEYLFHGKDGRKYTQDTVRRAFHRILYEAGVKRRSSGQYPRLHDFRHLFSIRALEQMVEKGYDLYTSLPILCKFLGHKSILETEYYIRLTQSRYSLLTNVSSEYAPNLFPALGVRTYE
jgi:integrase